MISAIILASGYSKRMGKNKLLLEFKGKPLIQYTLDTVFQCNFLEAFLIAREEEIETMGNEHHIKVIKNENAHRGISESIKLGVKAAGETEGYMFFNCDQPFLNKETVEILVKEFKKHSHCIIIPLCKGKRGSPVVFPYMYKEDFLALQGDVGGKVVINKNLHRVKYVEVEDGMSLLDVDTEEDYEYILRLGEKKKYV